MNSNAKLSTGLGKTSQPATSSLTSNNQSILIDKFNGRRSTPDSEALASSDDEGDRHDLGQTTFPPQKPTRRASWLNDTTQASAQPRKGSFASSTMSPTTSHPATPSADTNTWNSHTQNATGAGRGHSGSTSFPWGSGIWNTESRKEPPSRLTEVLPSPTSMHPSGPNGNGFFTNDLMNIQREQQPNQSIPFAIPLHPTPKTYRSQSYSVGQLESDSPAAAASAAAQPNVFAGRGRPLQHSRLQHRPSRPSMLSEMSSEGGLSKLKEVDDDDDESTNGSNHGVPVSSSNDKALVEALTRENAILHQKLNDPRTRARGIRGSYGLQETLPGESDYAIDELEEISELQELAAKGPLLRRLSEQYPASSQHRLPPYISLENRKIENVKKAYWQSSPGFGGLTELPGSRRHSFADVNVPTRQGSVSSIGDPLSGHENSLQDALASKDYGRYQDPTSYSLNEHGEQTFDTTRRGSFFASKLGQITEDSMSTSHQVPDQFSAASYFGGVAAAPRNDAFPTTHYQPQNYPYGAPAQYGAGRAPSPHRSMYGVPQPRHNQLLYIVLFKCSRADVFYVQEGTGLSVKPGDLVIVEADRGTDLGTVARDNVDWASAKDLKEHYAEEHYKWLMMYSQGAAGTADGTGAGLMAASNGLQGSAVGGMGPPSQHGMQEPNPGELKPKIIKRLAQNHEIQALRDKEGNEAKAKRVCMQKVKEHGLHMEILDAEFQMDWKKLTFYYFADAYINFNSLVTDLFKVYKTRIWII
ncbi:hypothetical protein M7I_7368 [Glarea lozoyensis 74030]|uniref:PSP1 C-terminal domain-containing protein n=1 Tax=Glarea lozoyensis (strain ATCC 74030 / MF5533) TaxID=1104152 RepID=H0EX43_GLAL7|nr:hypothetical protein M7I_7368 [Glarea lozoyensis 74030]